MLMEVGRPSSGPACAIKLMRRSHLNAWGSSKQQGLTHQTPYHRREHVTIFPQGILVINSVGSPRCIPALTPPDHPQKESPSSSGLSWKREPVQSNVSPISTFVKMLTPDSLPNQELPRFTRGHSRFFLNKGAQFLCKCDSMGRY